MISALFWHETNLTMPVRRGQTQPVKQALPKTFTEEEKPLEESYRQLFREQVSPLWTQEDSDFSLEQPAPVKFVPSVTTYGVSEEPIVR